jgi:hypothetical protein
MKGAGFIALSWWLALRRLPWAFQSEESEMAKFFRLTLA